MINRDGDTPTYALLIRCLIDRVAVLAIIFVSGLFLMGCVQPAHQHEATLADVVKSRAAAERMVARVEMLRHNHSHRSIVPYLKVKMRRADVLVQSQRYNAAYSAYREVLAHERVMWWAQGLHSEKTPTTNPAGKPTTRQRGETTSGVKLLKASWAWDIDSNSDCRERSDVFWHHVTESERYLVPQNGAELAVVIGKEYKKLSRTDLMKIKFGKHRISASNVNPLIDIGTVLAIKTSEGNFVKLLVQGFSPWKHGPKVITKHSIRLHYVLYME
jgi:hypothetical protein